jgi:hypothetical protein
MKGLGLGLGFRVNFFTYIFLKDLGFFFLKGLGLGFTCFFF